MPALRLGLIGDNIALSESPRLHRLAGRMCGLEISYERLIPAALKLDFAATFESCRGTFRGLNITYPYTEQVLPRLTSVDPVVASIGACNTVIFDGDAARGDNTDYSGFIAAFRQTFGSSAPGVVAMAGTGGVGRAIGFALAELGATTLRLFDVERAKAESLAQAIASASKTTPVTIAGSIEEAIAGADGLVNATPLGMAGKPGTPFNKALLGRQRWAFDAVYTPRDTQFLLDARAAGLAVMSGYELFLYQGIDAFRIFTDHEVDAVALRAAMLKPEKHRELA
jgi:shikimate dehydrogenase